MKDNLTERLEIRLSKKQKKSVEKIAKRYDVSFGYVVRMGLFDLDRKENLRG